MRRNFPARLRCATVAEEILIFQGHLPCAMKTEEEGVGRTRRYRRRRSVEIATFTSKRRPDRYRSLPTALRVVHVCPRVRAYVLVIALLERATLYLDKRRAKGEGGDKQAARYRDSITRNDDLSPLIETGLLLLQRG